MKLNFNINLPQKSIFGFKVLSSLQSSISCYIILFFGKTLSLYFGLSTTQIVAGALFNIILNISILILIFNLFIKRQQVQKFFFVLFNALLFFYLPFAVYEITINIKLLLILFL